MADFDHPLCCLCGDVGFPAKLFRCANCSHRFQHSYCSNYYHGESSAAASGQVIQVCDWCHSEQRKSGRRVSATNNSAVVNIQKGSGGQDNKITQRNSGAGLPSPRPAPRRYKLLKDVMC